MPTVIHPTAVVDAAAELGADVEIGPLCYVGPGVRLGDRTRLHHHASVEGNTWLGEACEIFPYACIGGKTQDLKFKGGNPGVRIGARNVFREYYTVHAATAAEGFTTIGDDNTFLAYGHVAHDCVVGSRVISSHGVGLAGHVTLDDDVVLGANCGVHQFCRVGAFAMISGYAKVVQDVAPFFIADGQPAVIRAINKIGLERKGFDAVRIERVKAIYRIMFRDGLNRSQALEKLAAHEQAETPEFVRMLDFARTSERGLAPGA
jgi:UDP-N-acetylglucosamine acyltransferase